MISVQANIPNDSRMIFIVNEYFKMNMLDLLNAYEWWY